MLYTAEEMRRERVPTAVAGQFAELSERLLREEFPCVFASQAFRANGILFTFSDRGDVQALNSGLSAFVEQLRNRSPRALALIAFVDYSARLSSIDEYRTRFWEILQTVHDSDEDGWPECFPFDPEHPGWMYCVRREPFFVFGNCPEYRITQSRNLGSGFVIVWVSRRAFVGIERGTASGDRIRLEIALRVAQYDGTVHPELKNVQLGWKAYFISDDGTLAAGRCPLRVNHVSFAGRRFRSAPRSSS